MIDDYDIYEIMNDMAGYYIDGDDEETDETDYEDKISDEDSCEEA